MISGYAPINQHRIFCLFVFVILFRYHSVHPFKCTVILNVTREPIFCGIFFNFSTHTHIGPQVKSAPDQIV